MSRECTGPTAGDPAFCVPRNMAEMRTAVSCCGLPCNHKPAASEDKDMQQYWRDKQGSTSDPCAKACSLLCCREIEKPFRGARRNCGIASRRRQASPSQKRPLASWVKFAVIVQQFVQRGTSEVLLIRWPSLPFSLLLDSRRTVVRTMFLR